MLVEGQILEGKYEVMHPIARGGVGEVYLGVNRRLGKSVAIKVLLPEYSQEPAAIDRFEQEARVAAMIDSAHIADVYDLGDLPTGEPFIVMELLDGENLADRLEREKRIPEGELAAMTLQILDALASAHEAGVVHRDLKPENVFVTKRDGRELVKVVDFGISKVVGGRGHVTARRLTLAGAVFGTPAYMSPEQARGKGVDHRSDLYSLGVMLYELVLGEPPFSGENVNELLFSVALDNAMPLELRLPSVSPALAAIVQKAMARAPSDRFQSAAEMRDAVLEWQATLAPGAATRAPLPSLTDGTLAGHTLAPTYRLSSATQPDEDDVELELRCIVPRRRSKGGFFVSAALCSLVALAVTHPDHVRTASAEVALRAAPLWKAAESKAAAAIAPANATVAPAATANVTSAPIVATSEAPPPPRLPATAASTTTSAPKPLLTPPPRATGKPAPPAKKASPPRALEDPPPRSATEDETTTKARDEESIF